MRSKDLSASNAVSGTITDKIVAAIEAGAGAFVMPWHRVSPGVGRPSDTQSGARYQGINVLALWVAAVAGGFGSVWWATYRQCEELGAQVRRGQDGTVIVFYKPLTETEDEEQDEEVRQRFLFRDFRVFNQDQVEGWGADRPHYPDRTGDRHGGDIRRTDPGLHSPRRRAALTITE